MDSWPTIGHVIPGPDVNLAANVNKCAAVFDLRDLRGSGFIQSSLALHLGRKGAVGLGRHAAGESLVGNGTAIRNAKSSLHKQGPDNGIVRILQTMLKVPSMSHVEISRDQGHPDLDR